MTREAWIVVDLGFGDAGKGATVDFLVRDRQAELVVRFNGGAQAGHNVVTPHGVHHTFAQLGSGTFVRHSRTLLGPRVVLHPGALLVEVAALARKGVGDALERVAVDQRALVISPFQQAACRLRELLRGAAPHGTCGVGIGEAVRDALVHTGDSIRAGDLDDPGRLLAAQQQRIRQQLAIAREIDDPRAVAEWQLLDDRDAVERTQVLWRSLAARLRRLSPAASLGMITRADVVIFEGAQGVLIDQDRGFHPHTTWSDCTTSGALELLAGSGALIRRLGVMRAHMVRHGPGPFPTATALAPSIGEELHNSDDGWQGSVRRGVLDLVLLRYAIAVSGGIDGLAVNHLDQVAEKELVCDAYRIDGALVSRLSAPAAGDHNGLEAFGQRLASVEPIFQRVVADELLSMITRALASPVWLVASGPTASDRRWLHHPR